LLSIFYFAQPTLRRAADHTANRHRCKRCDTHFA